MKKIFLTPLVAVLGGAMGVSAAILPINDSGQNPYRFARTVKAPGLTGTASLAAGALRAANPDKQFNTEAVSFLEGPDGTVWYAVSGFDYEHVVVNPYYTDHRITAFTFTVYDSSFNEIGSIHDVVRLQEGETRAAAIELSVTVTRKFFNIDNNYEVLVAQIFNKADLSEMPYVNTRTNVYSIGGEKDSDGNDVAIATIPGYSVAAVNGAADSWSENFYISFYEEQAGNVDDFTNFDDYLASYKAKVTTYQKAGYSTPFSELFTAEIPMVQLPGDQGSSPFFFSCVKDGKVTFVQSQYTKSLFQSPTDPYNEGLTPDNTLKVTVSQISGGWNPTLEQTATVEIPCVQNGGDSFYTFYSIGNLSYTGDVDFGNYTSDGKPAYVVTVDDYTPSSDSTLSSYHVYNSSAERILTLAQRTEDFVFMSDVAGEQPQVMFIHNAGGAYTFDFVDLYSGTTACSTGQTIGEYGLTTSIDRVADPAHGYLYAVSLQFSDTDAEGNYVEKIGWFNTDGEMVRVDGVNLGKNLTLAKAYISAEALSPYVFNTDTAMEYMFLVKRRNNGADAAVDEELVICAPDADPILTAVPDSEKGKIVNVALISGKENRLCVVYSIDDANGVTKYTQEIYNLPMARFAGGDGTPANPYLIATPGDLFQIKAAPDAAFSIVSDLDMTGFDYKPIPEFGGTLDGNGKKIKNLTLNGASGSTGLFAFTNPGAAIKNLTFVDATINLTSSTGKAAVVAAYATGTAIENVHVLGVTVGGDEYDDEYGTIAGRATNGTVISQCYVAGANVSLPSSSAAGIVSNLVTGSSVKSSAFSGIVTGSNNVGGIAADMASDAEISDCHVDALLTAGNTVGGIAANTARGKITRCHAEGAIVANDPSPWAGHAAGGIVGKIAAPTEDNDGTVVEGCLVTIESITALGGEDNTEEFPGQLDTAHRIAGLTSINMDPEILGWTEEWEPIYGDPIAEPGLVNNYVSSGIERLQAGIEAAANTTEGADIDRYEVGYDFLSGLGYAFGTTAGAPWSAASGYDPALHFETLVVLDNAELEAAVNETFAICLTILAREVPDDIFGDFTAEFDENKIAMTGNFSLEGNKLAIGMQALAEGLHSFSFSLLGSTVEGTVNVATSGVTDAVIGGNSLAITFDGSTIFADGAISVYNLAGTMVASGNGTVSAAALPAGIYIVRAVAADGNTATRKISK